MDLGTPDVQISKMTGIGEYVYGTIDNGGTNDLGRIFRFDKSGQDYFTIFSFDTLSSIHPRPNLYAINDRLYGSTTGGGNGSGLFYSINTEGSDFKSFDCPAGATIVLFFIVDMMVYARTSSSAIISISLNGYDYHELKKFPGLDRIESDPIIFFEKDSFIYGTTMQYKKLEVHRFIQGCASHQLQCTLIMNRSELPNFSYCRRWQQQKDYHETA
jgi:hypothetical protein